MSFATIAALIQALLKLKDQILAFIAGQKKTPAEVHQTIDQKVNDAMDEKKNNGRPGEIKL